MPRDRPSAGGQDSTIDGEFPTDIGGASGGGGAPERDFPLQYENRATRPGAGDEDFVFDKRPFGGSIIQIGTADSVNRITTSTKAPSSLFSGAALETSKVSAELSLAAGGLGDFQLTALAFNVTQQFTANFGFSFTGLGDAFNGGLRDIADSPVRTIFTGPYTFDGTSLSFSTGITLTQTTTQSFGFRLPDIQLGPVAVFGPLTSPTATTLGYVNYVNSPNISPSLSKSGGSIANYIAGDGSVSFRGLITYQRINLDGPDQTFSSPATQLDTGGLGL